MNKKMNIKITKRNESPPIHYNKNEDDFSLEIDSILPSRAQVEVVKDITTNEFDDACCIDQKPLKIAPHHG